MSMIEELEIADFYNLPTLFTIPNSIYFLLKRGFLKELTNNTGTPNYQTIANLDRDKAESKIVIKIHTAQQANLHSVMPLNQWINGSVWFTNSPCMIIRNPDYIFNQDSLPKLFITNPDSYKQMIYYIFRYMEEEKLIDRSIRNQGVYSKRLLQGDRILEEPQVVDQPRAYDLELAKQAINLHIDNKLSYG